MSDPFQLEEFEYLPATAGTALVRVAGTWEAQDVAQPALVVRTPFGDDRVEPLPDSAGEPVTGAPWRAAFSLALHVITGGSAQFLLDAGPGQLVELPQPSERGAADGFDRVAAGRELGELRAANDRLSKRVQELAAELASSRQELKPRQARAVSKAKDEAARERAMRLDLEQRLQVQAENTRQAQEQLADAKVAARVAETELERLGTERTALEARLSELVEEEGTARGAHDVLQDGLAELRAERDELRAEMAAARSQAAEGARQAEQQLRHAEEAERRAAEAESKLETIARRLVEAEERAGDAEARAAEAEKGLEYARAAVAAAVASEAGDERAAVALEEARQEAEDAQTQASLLKAELEAVKSASAQALELVESRAEEALAEMERRVVAEGSAEAQARVAAAEREVAEAQRQVAEAERKLGEERERRAVELASVKEQLTEAQAAARGGAAEQGAVQKLERELGQLKAESERRSAEVTQLKRRALKAEREAAEAAKARDRALEDSRRAAKRPARERPPREKTARRPAPVPVREVAVQEIGPAIAQRLEAESLEEGERVRLEAALESARGAVERTARAQLKRSSRGALRDATARLAESLAEGERLLYLAGGGQRDARRLVAVTDRRLLVLEGAEGDPEVLRYDEVDSVQAARRGTLQVSTRRGQFKIEQVSGDLDGLVQYVNQRIWDHLHRAGEEAS